MPDSPKDLRDERRNEVNAKSDSVKRLQIPLFKTVPGLSVFRLLNGLNLEFPERLKDVECRVRATRGREKVLG